MNRTTPPERRRLEGLDRAALEAVQVRRFGELLAAILPANAFYQHKLGGCAPPDTFEQFRQLPFTTKPELIGPPTGGNWAANLTFPHERYLRYHQTSGTHGRPLVLLDTADDWRWWMECWQYVLDALEVTAADRVLMAFSFGPFVGFWSAHDAVAERGAMVVPGGGLSTAARLQLLADCQATIVFSTPSYLLRMAEVAAETGVDLAALPVRCVVAAGEPGGSVPSIRAAIERAWGARVLDHSGATEIGPWGYGDRNGAGLFVTETEFIAEVLDLATGQPADDGELGELVMTNLGRVGAPVIRYRTGDVVRPRWTDSGPQRFLFLEGGILGRTDDMLVVRGVNIFPSAIDQIVRGIADVVEYRVTVTRAGQLDQLAVEVEDRAADPQRIARQLEMRLGLKVAVAAVPLGSLPRSEGGKTRRFIDRRREGAS